MKYCPKCKLHKELTDFSVNKTKRDNLNYQCKSCHSNYRKKHYQKNKQKYITKAKNNRRIQEEKYNKYKESLSCEICKENTTCCLDFHHKNTSEKEFNVSSMKSFISFESLLKEINKCIVVCSNCHRKIHAGIIQLVE